MERSSYEGWFQTSRLSKKEVGTSQAALGGAVVQKVWADDSFGVHLEGLKRSILKFLLLTY